jgi:hypothetical protein
MAKFLESKEVVFDTMLQHYNPYYKSLTANARKMIHEQSGCLRRGEGIQLHRY